MQSFFVFLTGWQLKKSEDFPQISYKDGASFGDCKRQIFKSFLKPLRFAEELQRDTKTKVSHSQNIWPLKLFSSMLQRLS